MQLFLQRTLINLLVHINIHQLNMHSSIVYTNVIYGNWYIFLFNSMSWMCVPVV